MARKILVDLHNRLRKLERSRERMESLHKFGRITRSDIEVVYDSLFIKAVTGFEEFSEQLFFGILQRKIRRYKRSDLLKDIRFGSDVSIRNLLLAGQRQKFFTWMPITDAIARAKIYLEDGRPFSDIDQNEKALLATISKIRNAVAHESAYAVAEFKKVLQNNPHSSGTKTPAAFLRHQFRSNPDQNYFQVYIGTLGSVALKLC